MDPASAGKTKRPIADIPGTREKLSMNKLLSTAMLPVMLVGGCTSPAGPRQDVIARPNVLGGFPRQMALGRIDSGAWYSTGRDLRTKVHAHVEFECQPGRFALELEQLRARQTKVLGDANARTLCVHVIQLPQRATYRKLAVTVAGLPSNRYLGFYGLGLGEVWYDIAPSAYAVNFDPTSDSVQLTDAGADGVPNVILKRYSLETILYFDSQVGSYVRIHTYEERHGRSR
jgi:hypothetical protein